MDDQEDHRQRADADHAGSAEDCEEGSGNDARLAQSSTATVHEYVRQEADREEHECNWASSWICSEGRGL